jgi:[ribosomal protein S18]-alanine N-acetyltransferase
MTAIDLTPVDMAGIHRAAFSFMRAWSAEEIAGLLGSPLCFALGAGDGFVLGRVVANEAELLTIAVHPARQRLGLGQHLLAGFLTEAERRGATRAFLEVAEDNQAAISLYRARGFVEIARRKKYYSTPAGLVDALIFAKALPDATPGF